MNLPVISLILVSYNTRELTLRCLADAEKRCASLATEIIVIDNGSRDGTAAEIQRLFPTVELIRAPHNLGFAAANNLGFARAKGQYCVLLNTDAFLHEGAMQLAVAHMDADPKIGLAGGRLVGPAGEWQPSARMFPSPLNDFLHLSGLAARYPASPFFGRADRTWADPAQSAPADWVPGAFSIIRSSALRKVGGGFDERFFLYYEEVDLCRRIKAAGYTVWYFGDVVITHLGGETTKATGEQHHFSEAGSQLTLWRMRSMLLYYRKQCGRAVAWLSYAIESGWHRLRYWKNRSNDKGSYSLQIVRLLKQAWQETEGGAVSPPRPW